MEAYLEQIFDAQTWLDAISHYMIIFVYIMVEEFEIIICTVGCFLNYTLQKKKMQYQYAPLTGVYKPDMKEFFS